MSDEFERIRRLSLELRERETNSRTLTNSSSMDGTVRSKERIETHDANLNASTTAQNSAPDTSPTVSVPKEQRTPRARKKTPKNASKDANDTRSDASRTRTDASVTRTTIDAKNTRIDAFSDAENTRQNAKNTRFDALSDASDDASSVGIESIITKGIQECTIFPATKSAKRALDLSPLAQQKVPNTRDTPYR